MSFLFKKFIIFFILSFRKYIHRRSPHTAISIKFRRFFKSVTQKMSYRKEVIRSVAGASLFVFLCLLIVSKANASIGIFQAEIDPLQNGCKLENEFFMFGVSPTQGFCGQVDCDENCHCFIYR